MASRRAARKSTERLENEGTGVAGEGGIVSGMAGRYATALFELALETKAVDQVQSDLKAFDALLIVAELPVGAGSEPRRVNASSQGRWSGTSPARACSTAQ